MMTDDQLLDFEEAHPTAGPRKDAAILARGVKLVRYSQRLHQLRRLPSTLKTHPTLVHRLERQAELHRRRRAERRIA